MKLIKTLTLGQNRAKLYRGDGEYRVKFYDHSQYLDQADYFTEDQTDATGTAWAELWRMSPKAAERAQIEARVNHFAKLHGRTWRDDLATCWANGQDAGLPDGHLLRIARNYCGPAWLAAYTPA